MSTGRAPALRHCKRTHCVSIAWLHERFLGYDMVLNECVSNVMAADILPNILLVRISGSRFAC